MPHCTCEQRQKLLVCFLRNRSASRPVGRSISLRDVVLASRVYGCRYARALVVRRERERYPGLTRCWPPLLLAATVIQATLASGGNGDTGHEARVPRVVSLGCWVWGVGCWMSHGCCMSCHMGITWLSHGRHMGVTWVFRPLR